LASINTLQIYLTTRAEWRKWLTQHHSEESGIWLVFYKKHTRMPTLHYDAVVEEALCFGWIDSIIKKLDDDRYARKLTPRKPSSQWSELNKNRVKKLLRQGLMTDAGVARIEEAKKTGHWNQSARTHIPTGVPDDLKRALNKNRKAKAFFSTLAPTYQKQFIGWIATAKRQETIDRRVKEAISLLKQGKKLGLK
jgi:uncharacterized protein YdeI (YjbR/CyaY-like superfamily)